MKKNYILTLVLLVSVAINAQVGNSFENTPGVAVSSSTADGCMYTDANITAHELENYTASCGLIYVKESSSGTTLGYKTFYTPSANGTIGFSDGDAFGVSNALGLADELAGVTATDGDQAFFMEDTDGTVTMEFDPVTFSGGSPSVSLDYYPEDTGWEAADVFKVEVEITNCGGSNTILTLIDTTGQDIDALGIENQWNTLNQSLASYNTCTAKLIITVDVESSSEEFAFDNVQFSAGNVLSTDEFSLSNALSVYPNPSNNGSFTIKNNGVALQSVNITDINGRSIYSTNLNGITSDQVLDLNLATGLYFVNIQSDEASTIKKLIVK